MKSSSKNANWNRLHKLCALTATIERYDYRKICKLFRSKKNSKIQIHSILRSLAENHSLVCDKLQSILGRNRQTHQSCGILWFWRVQICVSWLSEFITELKPAESVKINCVRVHVATKKSIRFRIHQTFRDQKMANMLTKQWKVLLKHYIWMALKLWRVLTEHRRMRCRINNCLHVGNFTR